MEKSTSKRLFPSTQLIVALDSKVLKVFLWILSWSSSQGSVKYYSKQFAKACKMTEEEVEQCIQSLVNAGLIDVSRIDQTFMLTPNEEQNQRYYKVPISKVLEGAGIPMAKEVTWNETSDAVQEKKGDNLDEMSDDDLKRLLLRIEASLSERKQVKELVKSASNSDDNLGLPF